MAPPHTYEESGTSSSEFLIPQNKLSCLCNWATQGQEACSQYPFLFLVPCGTQQVLIKCQRAEKMGKNVATWLQKRLPSKNKAIHLGKKDIHGYIRYNI